ncbi:hypothetical protein J2X34_001414 [Rhodococcus sp. BE178]
MTIGVRSQSQAMRRAVAMVSGPIHGIQATSLSPNVSA